MGWISAIYDLAVARSGQKVRKHGRGHSHLEPKKIPDAEVLRLRREFKTVRNGEIMAWYRSEAVKLGVSPYTIANIISFTVRSSPNHPLDPDLDN